MNVVGIFGDMHRFTMDEYFMIEKLRTKYFEHLVSGTVDIALKNVSCDIVKG